MAFNNLLNNIFSNIGIISLALAFVINLKSDTLKCFLKYYTQNKLIDKSLSKYISL